MIQESYYWRKELYECFVKIAKYRLMKKIKLPSYVKLEKSIMIGSFIIRKLNESEKIPPDMLDRKIILEKFLNIDPSVKSDNIQRIEKYYNTENIQTEERNWLFLINQIIHSFSFQLFYNESGQVEGILVNSDKTKNKAVYLISLKQILELYISISEGEINYIQRKRNDLDEMVTVSVKYGYPSSINLEEIINETLKGNIYKRKKN